MCIATEFARSRVKAAVILNTEKLKELKVTYDVNVAPNTPPQNHRLRIVQRPIYDNF